MILPVVKVIRTFNILFLLLNYLKWSLSVTHYTVNTKQGALKGFSVEYEFGKFVQFNGIPYAEPPVGDLRFKDPQPRKPWNGVQDAINEGEACAQFAILDSKFVGGEDCLYLNVATKNLTGKKPVMVWIHGGAFSSSSGSSKTFRGDYLVQHDIVYVSINYRLGMLGFLNMDIESCSGNQGLKDQVLALKWVQENIGAFGGDKNSVTIFGNSAGAVSVHYLCISPLAKGLFHKAIAQSGVSTIPWGYQISNKEYATKIAAELGSYSSKDEEILEFLRTVEPRRILETQSKVFGAVKNDQMGLDFLFVPTMDIKSQNPLLPRPLSEMIKKEIDVPLILGYNSHEGMLVLGTPDIEDVYKNLNKNFQKALYKDLKFNSTIDSKLSTTLRQLYFGKREITKKEVNNLIQYKGDVFFVSAIWYILQNQLRKKTPTYLYKYSHILDFSILRTFLKTDIKGACHSDEIMHLFYKTALPPSKQLQKGTSDYLIMQQMTKMWTDFAKTGNPTPEINDRITKWSPYKSGRKTCLRIFDNLTVNNNFEEKSWNLWKPFYKKLFL